MPIRPKDRRELYGALEKACGKRKLVQQSDFDILWEIGGKSPPAHELVYLGLPGCRYRAQAQPTAAKQPWEIFMIFMDGGVVEREPSNEPWHHVERWIAGIEEDLIALPAVRAFEQLQAELDRFKSDADDRYFSAEEGAEMRERLAEFERRLSEFESTGGAAREHAARIAELEKLLDAMTRGRWIALLARRISTLIKDPEMQAALAQSTAFLKELTQVAGS